MSKKKTSRPVQIRVFGEYVDKQGKKRKGFVKYDGRKKQTIYISDKKSGKSYKLIDKIGNKKSFKEFKKKASSYIAKKYSTYKGTKILSHTPKLKIKRVDFVTSKPYSKSYEKGEFKRKEAIEYAANIFDSKSIFFSAFSYARKTKAEIVIPVIHIIVDFGKMKKGTYIADWFIFARRIDANLNEKELRKLWNNIQVKILERVSGIREDYTTKSIKIKFFLNWLYKIGE